MKQMTKEELIEYFIEQLGDNEVLGKIMTIDQIREKLNYMIKDVTYNKEIRNYMASWSYENDGRGVINFDLDQIEEGQEKNNIVHELLHVLSTSSNNSINKTFFRKCGIHLAYRHKNFENEWNRAINEGITDVLTEQITGNARSGYQEEKGFYKMLCAIIGEENILRKYFGDIKKEDCKKRSDFEESALDLFKEDLLKKYGREFGIEINNAIKKAIHLSENLSILNYKDEMGELGVEGRQLQQTTKETIYKTFLNVLEKIFEKEQNLDKRLELVTVIGSYYNEDIYTRKLKEILDNSNMSYEQRMAMLEKIREKVYIPYDIIEETLFEAPEASDMDCGLKLEKYLYLSKFDHKNPYMRKIAYELYVESGKLQEGTFCKRVIFNDCVHECQTMQDIDDRLNNVKYQKVGEFYRICGEYSPVVGTLYNQNGEKVEPSGLRFDPLKEEHVSRTLDIMKLEKIIPKEKIELVEEQFRDKFKEYETQCQDENEEYRSRIAMIGNIFVLQYYPRTKIEGKRIEEFFEIDENGQIKPIELRRRKKNCR